MTIQLSDTLRTNMAAQYESTIGAAPLLRIYNGTKPATCAAAIGAATQLFNLALPSDWMTPGAAGTVSKAGTWAGPASATNSASFYRIWNAAGTICGEQGTVGVTGSGADLEVDNINVTSGLTVTITAWTRTQSGA